MMAFRTLVMKISLSEIAEIAAYAVILTAVMAGFLVTLFHASVNYTYRYNPPTAEEIAQDPTLERFLK